MTDRFIKNLAHSRADSIFTPEYYKHVTDSWYLDEKFGFENLKVGPNGRKPTEEEADLYMGYLLDLFKKYRKWINRLIIQFLKVLKLEIIFSL